MTALAVYLNIAGLTLDFLGAAVLAYDALHGAEARWKAATRRARLQLVLEDQQRRERSIRELAESPQTSEDKLRFLREQMPALTQLIDQLLAEIRLWERQEQRVHSYAVRGLLLLMAGFACQGLGNVISMTATQVPA